MLGDLIESHAMTLSDAFDSGLDDALDDGKPALLLTGISRL